MLDDDEHERARLLRDLLAPWSGFFHDPESFAVLRRQVIPELFRDRDPNEPIRVWIAGCATGEEAYSIAMLLAERAEVSFDDYRFQVFASDVDRQALRIARAGRYPEAAAVTIPPPLLRDFFEHDGGYYQVKPELRERIVFAPHNLLTDPPYSRLDLISCRNLLTDLNAETRERVIALFHFALRKHGVLFLGDSETIDPSDAFEPVTQGHPIYRRRGGRQSGHGIFPVTERHGRPPTDIAVAARGHAQPALDPIGQATGDLLLREYVPAAVVVDHKLDILYGFGPTQQYLALPYGKFSRHLMALAPRDLRTALRTVTGQALRENRPVTLTAHFKPTGEPQVLIRVSARPLHRPETAGSLLLVTLERELELTTAATDDPAAHGDFEHRLMRELHTTREELHITVQALEAANEELESSSDEIMTINDRLRSTHEVLETSQEELRSVNEVLATTNDELQHKVRQLENAHDDLDNLFSSTQIATLFLDRGAYIKRFTPPIRQFLDLADADIGRPLSELTLKFDDPELVRDAGAVFQESALREREVSTADGKWFLRRILPYHTRKAAVQGVVVTFADITALKQAAMNVAHKEEQLRLLADSLPALIAYVDEHRRYRFNNAAYGHWFGLKLPDVYGVSIVEMHGESFYERVKPYVEAALAGRRVTFETTLTHVDMGMRAVQLSYIPHTASDGRVVGFYSLASDITDAKRRERSAADQQAELSYVHRVATMGEMATSLAHELNQPLGAITGYVGGLTRMLDAGTTKGDAVSVLQKISEQAQRAADIVRGVREFVDRGARTQTLVDMNELLRKAISLTEAQTRQVGARVHLREVADLPRVRGEMVQLEQVLVNLITNALQAMENVDRRNRKLTLGSVELDNGCIEVAVCDTGEGIAADRLSRIFETFYTTKRDGMGMGLAISRSIVEAHGGSLWAESTPGEGTHFFLRLPVADGDASDADH